MDSLLSFPVGLFHPLQHAGLSRRSPDGRRLAKNIRAPRTFTSSVAVEFTAIRAESLTGIEQPCTRGRNRCVRVCLYFQ